MGNCKIHVTLLIFFFTFCWHGFVYADTYSQDTTVALTSPAVDFTITAGSQASSLTVNTGSVAVTTIAGSTFTMTSASRSFSYTGQTANAIINVSCNSNAVATIEVASSNTSNQTLTITPGDAPCTPPSSGGGNSYTPTILGKGWTFAPPAPKTSIPIANPPVNSSCSPYLTAYMKLGQKNPKDQVAKLQKFLARDKKVYPEGMITGTFGSLTKKAVIRFQEKYRAEILAPSGNTKGTGAVAQNTLKKINTLVCGGITTP